MLRHWVRRLITITGMLSLQDAGQVSWDARSYAQNMRNVSVSGKLHYITLKKF